MSYRIEYQQDGTANTEWKGEHSELKVRWSQDDVKALFFHLKTSDTSASTALSIEGIRVIDTQNSLRFSNPDKQFMQDVVVPKSFGLFLCEHHNIQVESEETA